MADKEIASLTAASSIAGSELLRCVQSTLPRKVDIDTILTFSGAGFVGFRATNSSTQGLTATITAEVVLATEIFDTESAFASNRFTVPSGLNGKYMEFTGGVLLSSSPTEHRSIIQQSTDGGSSWIDRAMTINDFTNIFSATGPCLLNTGDIWRLASYSNLARTIDISDRTFFSGAIL
jgi:hypothetical protein